WAAGSSVSASIPIAVVRVPPCFGPGLVFDVLPLPHAARTSAVRPRTAAIRACIYPHTSIPRFLIGDCGAVYEQHTGACTVRTAAAVRERPRPYVPPATSRS